MLPLQVIVPTYNDPHRLRLCLYGLTRQTLPWDQYFVYVISDGGDQKPDKDVLKEAFGWGLNVRYGWVGPRSESFQAGRARNIFRSGKQISARTLFVDQDCVLSPTTLAAHAAYGDQPVVVCGARRHIPELLVQSLTEDSLETLDHRDYLNDQRYRQMGGPYTDTYKRLAAGEREVPLHWRLAWGFQMSVPTAMAREIGGFNEAFTGYGGEDQEFAARLEKKGCKILGRFDLECYHLDHPKRSGDWMQRVAESVAKSDPVRNRGPHNAQPDDQARSTGRSD